MKAFIGFAIRVRKIRSGSILVLTITGVALFAPLLVQYAPEYIPPDHTEWQLSAPSRDHSFGTDIHGRDVLSRVLYGTRTSLAIAFLSVLTMLTIGTVVGLVAGFIGGTVDTVLMRFVDALLAIPRLILLLVVLALWERVGVVELVVILGLTSWFGVSRLVRAEVLSLRERDFMVAVRALGITPLGALARHLLPNTLSPITVTAALGMGQMILIEAGVSFLGFGVRVPTASLGRMIGQGYDYLVAAPWISIFPGIMIVSLVIGFSLIGDGLRDVVNPRIR